MDAELGNLRDDEASRCRAIELAERFVVEQGYTDLPPGDSTLVLTPADQLTRDDRAKILEDRYGSLSQKATGAFWEEKHGHWMVAFEVLKSYQLKTLEPGESLDSQWRWGGVPLPKTAPQRRIGQGVVVGGKMKSLYMADEALDIDWPGFKKCDSTR